MSGEDLLEDPLYYLADAARLVGTTAAALTRWSAPHKLRRHYAEPSLVQPLIITPKSLNGRVFSFLNLIEAHFIVCYRRSGVSLGAVQAAVEYARRELRDEHPLRARRFQTDGQGLFHRVQEERGFSGLVTFSASGQLAWPELVEEFLQSIEYDDAQRPSRWWPLGRPKPIIVDPRFAFGYPVVLDKHVRTDILAERFEAGEDFDEIAVDFRIQKAQVEEAVRYELHLKAA